MSEDSTIYLFRYRDGETDRWRPSDMREADIPDLDALIAYAVEQNGSVEHAGDQVVKIDIEWGATVWTPRFGKS